MKRFTVFCLALGCITGLYAQTKEIDPAYSKFEQLGTALPTPNNYRSASGAPGPQYWQQRADYDIKAELDDNNRRITGAETITYYNNSPDELGYLWLQLDQNLFDKESNTLKTQTGTLNNSVSFNAMSFVTRSQFDGGFKITAVKDKSGNKLTHIINKTMMRVNLPQPLRPGQKFIFSVEWNYNINDMQKIRGRSGYEFFPADGNCTYTIAQWFPRMAVYDDVWGWQHKQFLGQGEFALTFGNYKVALTVPDDHIVGATGNLMNEKQVLTSTQIQRLKEAETAKNPVVIVNQQEAIEAEKKKSTGKKTWIFQAENVRDFAWCSSRRYIWDAKLCDVEGAKVWAMSYYPKEGNPLWGQYSTRAVEHTLKSYSKRTVAYPYPKAISVHWIGNGGGMEYPMICFNGGRPEADGTYSAQTKYGMIGVIIHEVGHNFFPMIVNSDERQWSWMDEGLNSFCQYLAEQEWERGYPSWNGEPYQIVSYMRSSKETLVPIMTNSEQVLQFGPNAYDKPATALNILRETVIGRELFDIAFKEYATRWAFKHPHPADFFRSMEDATGVDLDWFWRGWFYGIDPVEVSLEDVNYYKINSQNPDVEKPLAKADADSKPKTISQQRNAEEIKKTLVDDNPELNDFYNSYNPYQITPEDKAQFDSYYKNLTPEEKKLIESGLHFYTLKLKNNGGLISPVIVKMEFEDGTEKIETYPAEIWRLNSKEISKVIFTDKPVKQFTLDPYLQTADIDTENNYFPRKPEASRFQLFKQQGNRPKNPMQQAQKASGQQK
ncbi:M1 family metallopeptidase [Cytophagaceae bacterium DM2B3-1]|uniref:M1 family metallopeptidase n=1 Tax=Xanthocytophaga flava TaxID=3048013 RepID=A0ABT7CQV5_9BACT|nr:M1 family metallopeptidase [Xanthocytophaga flavus]MDJ1472748.1 M1 family metallopeptidase [Xanthocytophaga flavus]MDJ1496125.1 M1 family metallopeptidase [Xanthocytophaga flavus]